MSQIGAIREAFLTSMSGLKAKEAADIPGSVLL